MAIWNVRVMTDWTGRNLWIGIVRARYVSRARQIARRKFKLGDQIFSVDKRGEPVVTRYEQVMAERYG